jgi:hypothetical protein
MIDDIKIKSSQIMEESRTRSADRIRDLAEVFTGEREVNSMLDLVEASSRNVSSRFLEPACGNGNFLVQILARKMSRVITSYKNQIDYEFYVALAATSIYGIDIDKVNIEEARDRLFESIVDHYSMQLNTCSRSKNFDRVIRHIVKTNIQRGDMVNGVSKIFFTEFTCPKPHVFLRRVYRLTDLLSHDRNSLWGDQMPVFREYEPRHFLELL